MIITLDKINFVSDIYSVIIPDGSTLILNKIEESLKIDSGEVPINCINIEVNTLEGDIITCSNVIGLENKIFKITTEYKQYEGEVLTSENMKYCILEVYES